MNTQKKTIAKNIGLVFLGWLIIAMLTLTLGSCGVSNQAKGYNYKAHQSKNAKFKMNNERGNYMKCKRH